MPPATSAVTPLEERQRMIAPAVDWSKVPWAADGWYLSSRPSFITDPAWHAGLYYVQEASSMFLEQVFSQHVGGAAGGATAGVNGAAGPLRVLDACAAPGGKSTHLQALIGSDGLLVSNEVIRTRVSILSENLQRWGAGNTIVTQNDPRDFAGLPGFFDVLLVDAPCSGSGLFRREPEAIGEWSPSLVQLCSQRQERILSDLWGSLREGGVLIYSTCSYSVGEDEQILDWLSRSFAVESLRLDIDEQWGVVEARGGAYGYRFYPNRLAGEGFFIAVFRKKGDSPAAAGYGGPSRSHRAGPHQRRPGGEPLGKGIAEGLTPWLQNPERYHLFQTGETIRALPMGFSEDLVRLSAVLNVREAGVTLGEWMRNGLVPDQGLAMSGLLSPDIPRLELTREEGLAYVRKDELRLEGLPQGWVLVTYGGYGLGWVKVLAGRINNYYPKHWRVLKR